MYVNDFIAEIAFVDGECSTVIEKIELKYLNLVSFQCCSVDNYFSIHSVIILW